MRSESLVSVIVIFLDEERFLEEAIESVLAQTYENWELLLVDDGSTDASTEIAKAYAASWPEKVFYIEHPDHSNRGMSASRNLGIDRARGEFVAFLDGDDVWLPEKLEQQVTILRSQPTAAMLYGRSQYWYSWSEHQDNADHMQDHFIESETLVESARLPPLYLQGMAAVPPPSSILVRRSAVEDIAGFEESFTGMYEDQAFYVKLALRHAVYVSDRCWDKYRQHPESACSEADRKGGTVAARLAFLEWFQSYLENQEVREQGLLRIVRREQWLCHHPNFGRPLRSWRRLLRRLRSAALIAGRSSG